MKKEIPIQHVRQQSTVLCLEFLSFTDLVDGYFLFPLRAKPWHASQPNKTSLMETKVVFWWTCLLWAPNRNQNPSIDKPYCLHMPKNHLRFLWYCMQAAYTRVMKIGLSEKGDTSAIRATTINHSFVQSFLHLLIWFVDIWFACQYIIDQVRNSRLQTNFTGSCNLSVNEHVTVDVMPGFCVWNWWCWCFIDWWVDEIFDWWYVLF